MDKTASDAHRVRRGRSPVAVDGDSRLLVRIAGAGGGTSAGTGADAGKPSSLMVDEFGRHRIAHRIRERRLPCYVLVFVEHGHGRFRSERGTEQVIDAPAVFWLVPGVAHTYGPAPGTVWSERWVACRGAVIDELQAEGLVDPAVPRVRLSGPGALERQFDALEAAMSEDGRLARARSASIVHTLATTVAELAGEGVAAPPPPGAMARLIDEVRQRALGDIDFAALAAVNGMSAVTLRRRFRRYTGMAPKAFQLHLRLDRARQLLVMSDRPIDEIAAAVGFRDGFYFSRLFSSRSGCSPSRFRRMYDRRE